MLHFSTKMLDNTHHVEAFFITFNAKKTKRCKKTTYTS